MIKSFKYSIFEKYLAFPLLIIITTLVFLPSLSNGLFCWDDKEVALSNFIQKLDFKQIKAFFTIFHAGLYHPLTTISFAIDYQIGQGSPFTYHLTNLILHLANTCLVYLLIKRLTSISIIPFFIACLFGIHPMHVESVAWITSRKDLLYCFFLLGSMLFYISYIKKNNFFLYYLLALLFFLFSSLSKIQAAFLPFILILIDYFFRRKLFTIKVILEKIPFFLIMVFLIIINFQAQKSYGYVNFNAMYSIPERLILFCYGIILYIVKIIIPYPVSVFYPFPFPPSAFISFVYFLYPAVILFILFGLTWLILRSCRDEVFGLSFFLISIFLVLLVNNYREYIITNKYSYVASIGIFYYLSIVGYKLFQKYSINKWLIVTIVFSYLIASSLLTYHQNKLWNSPLKLFNDALRQYPKSPIILTTLGSIATDSGMYEKAIEYLNLAVSIDKKNVYTYYNRGVTEYRQKKYELAIKDFSLAIYLNPNYLDPYFGRGNIYSNIGEYQKALDDYSYILIRNVNYTGAWQNRAIVKGNLNDFSGAIDDLNHAISLNPKSGSSYFLRGIAKFEIGIDGCEDLTAALSLNYEDAKTAIQHYCK